jgi:hypothetical protein
VKPIQRDEILSLGEYERIRDPFRARVIAAKRARRVSLGPWFSAVFENRDTVMLQVQEMLRTERITAEAGIAHELQTYNELLPKEAELSLTFFVEVPEQETRERLLVSLAGLERHIALEVDGVSFPALGSERDRQDEGTYAGRTTAVHYLKIPLGEGAREALRSRQAKVALVVTHPGAPARAELSPAALLALAEDLLG